MSDRIFLISFTLKDYALKKYDAIQIRSSPVRDSYMGQIEQIKLICIW